jgi:hypothetical protein
MSAISSDPPVFVPPLEPAGVNANPNPSSKVSRCWANFRSISGEIGRGFCRAPWKDNVMEDAFHNTTKGELAMSALIGLGCLAIKDFSPKMLASLALFPIGKYLIYAPRDQLSGWNKVGMSLKILVTSSITIATGFSIIYLPFYRYKLQ